MSVVVIVLSPLLPMSLFAFIFLSFFLYKQGGRDMASQATFPQDSFLTFPPLKTCLSILHIFKGTFWQWEEDKMIH